MVFLSCLGCVRPTAVVLGTTDGSILAYLNTVDPIKYVLSTELNILLVERLLWSTLHTGAGMYTNAFTVSLVCR